jgi:hypothetical protein
VETVLSKTIWGVDFFMICDGDSLARGAPGEAPPGRIRYLSRYHLENYFLDENTWERVFADCLAVPAGHPLTIASNIREQLRAFARSHVSYAVALKVANHFRQHIGNIDLMPKGVDQIPLEELVVLMEKKRGFELSRCSSRLTAASVEKSCREEFQKIDDALNSDLDLWKALIPGRPILKGFAERAGQDYATLKRLFVQVAKTIQPNPFEEIEEIFKSFNAC